MGDNRVNSTDSRMVGPFKGENIVGKDVYVFFPFNRMKIVGNGEQGIVVAKQSSNFYNEYMEGECYEI